MDFWDYQSKLKKSTKRLLLTFCVSNVFSSLIAEVLWRIGNDYYDNPINIEDFPYVGISFLFFTFVIATVTYTNYSVTGGKSIADSLSAKHIQPNTNCRIEKTLFNVCEEVAIASGMPLPYIYIFPNEGINAFAAGTDHSNYVIAVTSGALKKLNRDELQGVIAHEFGHLKNNDVCLSMQVTSMLMGLSFLSYIGFRFIEMFSRGIYFSHSSKKNKRTDGFIILGTAIAVAGIIGSLFGCILRANISRKREFLADAMAVQFTRSTTGLASALKKILQEDCATPPSSFVYSHLFLNNNDIFSYIFATHPPLEQRIHILEKQDFYIDRSDNNFEIK